MDYHVIVVGGGASGLMAAVTAAEAGKSVLLLEKNSTLGKKLLLTGGGRCNVTNSHSVDMIIQHIPGNGKFLYSAFSQFNNQDIISFFNKHGVQLKEEDHGRLFPITDSSKTILSVFTNQLHQLGVTVYTGASVQKLIQKDGQVLGVHLHDGQEFTAKAVILALGGKSYPKTGTSGDGYALARSAGHIITPLFATEVPLISQEPFIKDGTLRGLSLRNISLSVLNRKGKAIITHQMDMIFTHFGVSGPAVLRCSGFIHTIQHRENTHTVKLALDVLPDFTLEQLLAIFQTWQIQHPARFVKTQLKEWMPERYADFLLGQVGIDKQTSLQQISEQERLRLLSLIKHFIFTVSGTQPIEKGFVTGGGVSLKEVDPKTLASKKCKGLYFAGELLDIHGYTGGYNITAAFVTGHVAATHAIT